MKKVISSASFGTMQRCEVNISKIFNSISFRNKIFPRYVLTSFFLILMLSVTNYLFIIGAQCPLSYSSSIFSQSCYCCTKLFSTSFREWQKFLTQATTYFDVTNQFSIVRFGEGMSKDVPASRYLPSKQFLINVIFFKFCTGKTPGNEVEVNS